jgi:hypothetical protein
MTTDFDGSWTVDIVALRSEEDVEDCAPWVHLAGAPEFLSAAEARQLAAALAKVVATLDMIEAGVDAAG